MGCLQSECSATGTKRGYCERHYRQALRRGLVGDARPCVIPGCGRRAEALDRCGVHYNDYRRQTAPACAVDGCEVPQEARGFCRRHYMRFNRHGDPLAYVKPKRQRCSVDGCGRPQAAKGFCDLHYRRQRKYGSTELPAKPPVVDPPPFTCKWCGGETPKRRAGRAVYCSEEHRAAHLLVSNRQKQRAAHLKRAFGLTVEEFDALLAAQEGKCAICGTDETPKRGWVVDHCHSSGKVRGVLCTECNVGLGNFRDSVASLRSAIRYLARHA